MNTTRPCTPSPPTPTIEQYASPYAIGKGYLLQPNSLYVGCPPFGLQLPPSSPPPMAGGNLLLVYHKLVINLIIIFLILGWLPMFGNLFYPSNLVKFGPIVESLICVSFISNSYPSIYTSKISNTCESTFTCCCCISNYSISIG